MTRLVPALAAAITVAATVLMPAAGAAAGDRTNNGIIADYHGRQINLANGWHGAQACAITATTARCFDTETEMDAALGTASAPGITPYGTCSTALRLYDGANYGTPVVSIATTGSLVVLSSYGFDNKTSSYKVGACSATLYDGLQTGIYPGNTTAWAQATSMGTWNNKISSVLMP